MKFEKLVPPLELCRKIPAEFFTNSVFVWSYLCDKRIQTPFVEDRECLEFCRRDLINAPEVYPAPTLAEILADIPKKNDDDFRLRIQSGRFDVQEKMPLYGWECGYTPADSCWEQNPTSAALKFWLKKNTRWN